MNSFLAHRPLGGFCYVFVPHGGHTGAGKRFRATAIGPGVTPEMMWEAAAPGLYSALADGAADRDRTSLLRGDGVCRPN